MRDAFQKAKYACWSAHSVFHNGQLFAEDRFQPRICPPDTLKKIRVCFVVLTLPKPKGPPGRVLGTGGKALF